jgi:hypothetical protein
MSTTSALTSTIDRDSRSLHSLIDRFVSAGIDAGDPRNDDFNGRSQLGVGRYSPNKTAQRASDNRARPATNLSQHRA